MKSFLFKLLPDIVQQFFIWKNEMKEFSTLDVSTEFDKFISLRLSHEYKNLYAIVNVKTHKLLAINNRVCIFNDIDKVIKFYFKHELNNGNHKLCRMDMSSNIIKIIN